ncbi:MAG: alpha-L-arabinofuranosidase [Clostridia bacterium]|nr:alpha-L-arabinofuranosidase [Clostridia bacterium]
MKTIYLVHPKTIGTIAPEIYGHFSEQIGGVFYDGLWVGKDSHIPNIGGFRKELVEKLKAIHPPVLRWPGGCFAETYDWRDGIGENRPVRRNWWTPWDNRLEDNAVGTHEFLRLCELIGAKPYFAANLTSVTPMHIRNWMDYCLSPRGTTTLAKEREENGHAEPYDIPYWGVGNENWGGGGNMRPEFYTDEYRRFAELMHNAAPDVQLFVCGSNGPDYAWTHGVMPGLKASEKLVNGFAMHYYCGKAGDPLTFTTEEWYKQLQQAQKMEEIILRNWAIICGHGMQEKCGLVVDEWGCWHPDGSGPSKGYNLFEQQSTMRDAMVTALTLHIFNRHCDKVKMANVAQTVNNLHCLFLAGGENFTVTPTYHVFDLFKGHQGAACIETVVTDNDDFGSSLTVSASVKDGKTLVTVGNLSCEEDAVFSLASVGVELPAAATTKLLAHEDMHAHNTFEEPNTVQVQTFSLDPRQPITIPKAGIMAIEF